MCFMAAGLPAIFSAISGVVGTAVSAFGAVQAGNAQNDAAQYSAKVADNNATAERERASYDAGLIKDERRRIVGSQRAAMAANGLEISTGSPVAVLGDTTGQSEMDVLARLYGGESAATAYGNDATRMRIEGKAAKQAGMLGAGSTLLTGMGNLALNQQRYRAGYAPQLMY
jgi:hypothetical protein